MFTYELKYRENEKSESLNFIVIFSGQLEGDEFHYSYFFEKKFIEFLRPDAVIMLFPKYIAEEIAAMFWDGGRCYDGITRFGSRTDVKLISFNSRGVLSLELNINSNIGEIDLSLLRDCMIKDGLLSLLRARKSDVILQSPPGTVFSKPSGDTYSEFIKTSELTRDYSEHKFLAFCLLSRYPGSRAIDWIYIDTASISAVAQSIVFYLHKFSGEKNIIVKYKSFSSYFGLDGFRPGNTNKVWVIISASTSNNLGIKIANEWNLKDDQVLTILSYAESRKDNVGDKILLNISPFSESDKNAKLDSPTRVQIVGENFTAEISKPRKIIIRKDGGVKEIHKSIRPFVSSSVFNCNRSAEAGSANPKPIYINFNGAIFDNEEFSRWIETFLRWNIPCNMKWVLTKKYRGDKDGHKMFFEFLKRKADSLGLGLDLKAIDMVNDLESVKENDPVLILAPVITSGRSFLEVNRALRFINHRGNRIFLAAFATPSSRGGFDTFRKSITRGPDSFNYQFHNYFAIYTGESNESSWDLERKVVANLKPSEFWQEREKHLEQFSGGLSGRLGCPALSHDRGFGFAKDFVFWDFPYNESEVDKEAVYATVAFVLQNLREGDGANSLKSNIYQNSVIDPENFVRFSDSLLQSCIWRCANLNELDYIRSEDLSEIMANIIIKMMEGFFNHRSESVIDILMAIATKKMKLSRKPLLRLLEEAQGVFEGQDDAIMLLDYIRKVWKLPRD